MNPKVNLKEIQDLELRYYAHTFKRLPVVISQGEGMYLYDTSGKKYLDMFAGIAVNSLGHCHPKVIDTIKEQSQLLMHTSNWLYTLPQLELAKLLTEITGLKKVFLTNDGTEAVETAIKLVRKVTGKKEIIAMEGAFHGRTMGALSLTSGEKYRKPFGPLLPETRFVPFNDIDALRGAIGEKTAAVIVEPIQGESGVIIPDENYLSCVRELTLEKDVLFILDEIQTGFGRTGRLFAFEHSKIKPDILCLAKGIGSGFPIGATLFSCDDFEPGEHGGTFIGNPLACAVAKTVIETILKEKLVENSEKIGGYLLNNLRERNLKVRGRGLMIGIDVENGEKTVLDLIKRNVLTIYSKNTVRVLPPLIIEKKHADEFLKAVDSIDSLQ
ncbi:MAG: aspartate aminotransferase family protein [Candidatus Altiarchaeales archaeon]|nr:MAG: aspartate aminotransferase family protein [Candidatus Altiarchaeales archaeon]